MFSECSLQVCTCGRHRCPIHPGPKQSYDKQVLNTTYIRDYPEHPLNAFQRMKAPKQQLQGSVRFVGESECAANYIPWPIQQQARSFAAWPFFRQSTMCLAQAGIRRRGELLPTSGKFEGATTHQVDFQPKSVQRPPQTRLATVHTNARIAFQGERALPQQPLFYTNG